MNSTPLPWYVKTSLGIVSLLALPSYIGLVTKTKVWCALTGRCEFGGASYGGLAITAIFTTLLLSVFWYVVLSRKSALIFLTGMTQLLAFSLMSFFFTMNVIQLDQQPTLIDAMLLSAMLFIGFSLTTFAIGLFRKPVPIIQDAKIADTE